MAVEWTLRFHNLEGITIVEKKKNLYNFIREIPADKIDRFLEEMKPKTYLESIFKVEILIYFKKHVELLAILKNANEIVASKIIRHRWFLEETFQVIDVQKFVNEFLPQFSHSTQIKLLKSIPLILNELQVDSLFDQLSSRYGMQMAILILSKCSINKINTILTNNKIKLSFGQFIQIYHKDPDFLVSYLIDHKEEYNQKYYDKFLIYLSRRDSERFWKVCDNCDWQVQLGRKTTEKQLLIKKKDLIKSPEKYINYFRKDRLVRIMNKNNFEELAEIYEKLFPDTINNVHSIDVQSIIKYLPKHKRFPLFSNTHLKVLGKPVTENKKVLNHLLLELIQDESIREELADKIYNEDQENNGIKYLAYYRKETALKLIQERINVTSDIRQREDLIRALANFCCLHLDDPKTVEQVLEYFCKRHNKNDASSIRSLFIEGLFNDTDCHFKKFNKTHYKYIREILNSCQIHDDFGNCYNTTALVKYLEFEYNSGKPIKEYLRGYLQWSCSGKFYNGFLSIIETDTPKKDAIFEKQFLQLCVELIPEVFDRSEDRKRWQSIISDLVKSIHTHNEKNPGYIVLIRDNKVFAEILSDLISNPIDLSVTFGIKFIRYSICREERNDFEDKLVESFYSCEWYNYETPQVISWFIKHQPQIFNQYINDILKHTEIFGSLPWLIIKQYSHLQLDKNVINFCLKKLEEKEYKKNTAIPLAVIMSTEEYVKLLQQYVPTDYIMNMDNREEANKIKVQCDLALKSKNVSEKEKALESLLQFAYGDYFQHIHPALYSFFNGVPEEKLYLVIDELLTRRRKDSIKKHCVYLSMSVLKEQTTLSLFDRFKKVISMHKFMFKSLLHYCSNKSSSETVFTTLISYMRSLEKEDIEALKLIQNATKMLPKKYKVKFVQEAWNYFEYLRGSDEFKATQFDKIQLLFLYKSLQDDKNLVSELPLEFSKTLLNKYLLKAHTGPTVDAFIDFAYKFMLLNEKNFNFVFDIISELVKEFWEVHQIQQNTYKFFNYLKEGISHLDTKEKFKFVRNFKDKWAAIFSPVVTFKEHVILDLRLAYFQCEEPSLLQNFANAIVRLIKETVLEYGELIYNIYLDVLKNEIKVYIDTKNLLELFLYIMEADESSNLVAFLVMDLLLGTVKYNSINRTSQDRYKEIINKLKLNENKMVMLKYNMFQRNKFKHF